MTTFFKQNTSFKAAILTSVFIVLTSLFNSVFAQGYVTLGAQTTQLTGDVSSPVSGYYESRKIQIVYAAAEITAAGGAAGNISKLAWDVTNVYDGDPSGLPNYTISMGHYGSTSIPTTTFITAGLGSVKNSYSYIPALGFNDINFDTPFNWNGTSNIIIEICFNPAPFPGGVNYGTCWNYNGIANNYRDAEADGTDQCPETDAINTTITKPRVRFYMQQAVVTCDVPTTFTRYNTQTTTTVLSWTNPSAGSPASYTVEVRTSGAAGSGAVGFVTSFSVVHPTNITTVTGLSANTAYSAYVRTDCGGSGTSLYTSAVNFTTQCNSVSVPYTQNFDGAIVPNLPSCTSSQDLNGYTTWTSVTAPTSYTGKILRYTYDFGGNAADDWFYTVGINLTAGTEYRIKFKYGAHNPSYPERLKVCYGSAADAASMLTTLTNNANITTDVNYAKVDFTPATTGVYYFGFHAYSLANNDWLYLDDIDINVKPFCNAITNANAFGFSPTTAIISWTTAIPSSPPGNPSAYQIELRTSGAAGSGSTGLFSTYTTTHPTNVLTFTGLTANTSYTAHIKTDCGGGDYSLWNSVIFATPCVSTSIPYTENFDAATIPNLSSCTYKQDLNGGNTWLTATAPASYSGKVLQYSTHATLPANDWFYTSGLTLAAGTTYRFSFKYGNSNSSFTEKLAVKYGTSNSAETMTNALFNFTSINSALPQTATIDFSPATSGVYYFGFNAFSIANQSNLYIDDISIIVAPVCASPSNNAIIGLTPTSVVLSWTNPSIGIPLNYEIEMRTSGLGGSGAVGLVSTTTITHPTNITTITGLTTATSYTAFIRTNCGSGDYGTWQSFGNFSTPCIPISVPYNENFNTTSYPNIPNCTYKENIEPGLWYVFNASAMSYPDFIDECLVFEYDGSNSTNNWFYTSGLNLVGGITYKLSYKYRSNAAGQTNMKVSYGNSPIAATMVNTLSNYTLITAATNVTTTSFTPSSTGIYYIGFNSYAVGNSNFILIDDLSITGVPANSNSSLSALSTSVGTLSPVFASSTFNYTVTLPFGTTGGANLTPTVAAGTSTTVITSATNVAGSAPANVATVVVTAQDNSTSTYTVTYTIAPINSNSSLSALSTSAGTISPTFTSSTFNYTVTLPFGTTGGANVTPTVAAGTSTTVITSATNVAGAAPANVATVVVTAQDNSTSTYTVTFTIAPINNNSSLTNLTTSVGTLSPAFASGTFNYTVTLPFGTTGGANVTPTVAAGTSTTVITSATNVAGSAPANVATVVVTAQDNSTSTYTVTYSVSTVSTNATLSSLTSTPAGTFSPAFISGINNYTATLPYGTTGSATLTPVTTLPTSTATVVGATNVAGSSPANVAYVYILAQNGETSTYTVTFNFAAPNTDATLSSLTPSIGILNPAFDPSITSYTVNIPEGSNGLASLSGIVNNANATITVNMSAIDISSSDPLDNTAIITVTAQDGSTITYSVSFLLPVGINNSDVTKTCFVIYPNPNNGLSLLQINDEKSPTAQITIASIDGKIISEVEVKTINNKANYEINLTNEPKGVYFVKIKTNDTTLVKRVITY